MRRRIPRILATWLPYIPATNPNYAADLAGTGSALTSVPYTTTGNGYFGSYFNYSPGIKHNTYILICCSRLYHYGDNLFTNTTTATTFQFRLNRG